MLLSKQHFLTEYLHENKTYNYKYMIKMAITSHCVVVTFPSSIVSSNTADLQSNSRRSNMMLSD